MIPSTLTRDAHVATLLDLALRALEETRRDRHAGGWVERADRQATVRFE